MIGPDARAGATTRSIIIARTRPEHAPPAHSRQALLLRRASPSAPQHERSAATARRPTWSVVLPRVNGPLPLDRRRAHPLLRCAEQWRWAAASHGMDIGERRTSCRHPCCADERSPLARL